MAVAWPVVKDRLVAVLPTLPSMAGVTVYDGPVVTGDSPTAYVTVGWQPSTEDESAGSYEQEEGPDGFLAAESGEVLLEFAALTGDPDVPDAFFMVQALQAYMHNNMTLGGLLVTGSTTSLRVDVLDAQTQAGATQRLLATFRYSTHLV